MRIRKVRNSDKIIDNSKYIVNDYINLKGNWNNIFSNNNPIHLEIGMGKGKFINELAENSPNINFIGIEKQESVLALAILNIEESELPNLKLIEYNALKLDEIFSENELERIYLNFSDPWPKKRHTKRRLTFSTFLELYNNILSKNGYISMKTDNRDLFEYSLESFSEYGFIVRNIKLDLHDTDEKIVTTEYEDKFINKGNKIYAVDVYKKNNKM